MNALRITSLTAASALIVFGVTGLASAGTITPGLYELHSHPDGGERPPLYGLRLDELIDASDSHDVFTFDFDGEGAHMQMTYDGSSLHIFGFAFGGLNEGNGYADEHVGLWEIDFTYNNVTSSPGDDDLIVAAGEPENSGYIRALFDNGEQIALVDTAGNHPFSFRLGDGNNDNGHRGFEGISGWGWLNHGGLPHVYSSDFLFTAQPVPVPPAVALGLLGLLGVAGAEKKRRKAAQK